MHASFDGPDDQDDLHSIHAMCHLHQFNQIASIDSRPGAPSIHITRTDSAKVYTHKTVSPKVS